MIRILTILFLTMAPIMLFGSDDEFDTLSITPIGVDYSKYQGMNKLYIVGECEGMEGTQVVIFQNRPSFDFFDNDEAYVDEQKELEKAIWEEILDQDQEPIVVKGRWHQYNDRMVFLCHRIIQMNKVTQIVAQ